MLFLFKATFSSKISGISPKGYSGGEKQATVKPNSLGLSLESEISEGISSFLLSFICYNELALELDFSRFSM